MKRTAFRLSIVALALAAGLAALLLMRAAGARSRQPEVEPAPTLALDAQAVAERLGGALRIPSISPQDAERRDASAFRDLHAYLARSYPRVHAALERERVAGLSLLYTWPGNEPALDPLLLLAHQDVVPIEPGTEEDWQHPPFSGAVVDGYVWGRGALDDKLNLIAQLEAVEHLLAQGFRPRRTLLLAFGHDEELGGPEGATGVARLLDERGIRPSLVLDEGGAIVEGVVPGIAGPVAVIGAAEKGYVSLELAVEADGGHSSTPARESAIGILVDALGRLQENPFPARLVPPVRAFLDAIAAETTLGPRLVLTNLWLFEPVLLRGLEGRPETAAMIRTTVAPTILAAGIKDNAIPAQSRAVVNFRVLPGESIAEVIEHVRRGIGDERVRVTPLAKRREPSSFSRIDSDAFALLTRTIREVFPGTIAVPYLVVGGSDARHFEPISENVYRFMPFQLSSDDLGGVHGTNERVSAHALSEAVRFYVQLIRNAAGPAKAREGSGNPMPSAVASAPPSAMEVEPTAPGRPLAGEEGLAYHALWHLVGAFGFLALFVFNHVRFASGR